MKTCSTCKVEKPLSEFRFRSGSSTARRSICKKCAHAQSTVSTYKSRHGIDRDEVVALAEQQGGCAICGSTDPGKRGWAVDHDHSCAECTRKKGSCDNCRRGFLCNKCNTGLGLFNDNPQTLEAAIMYLDKWAKA